MPQPLPTLAVVCLPAGLAAGLAAGVGVAGASVRSGGGTAAGRLGPGVAHRLDLGALGSLTSYRFTSTASNGGYRLALTGTVHGPEDWEVEATMPVRETTYDVGGRGYAVVLGRVVPVTFRSPDGLSHLDGERTAAEGLIGYTHVAGIRITTKGACHVAGDAGTTYAVATPAASSGLLLETATACVADRSGALLSYTAGVPSGSDAAAYHLKGAVTTFRVEAIGGVGTIRAPKATPLPAVPTGTQPVAPAPGLPAGFPSAVPPPPGSVVSSARIGPAKWYVELHEASRSALSGYVRTLEAKGFAVERSSATAGGDVEELARGRLTVLAEQLSLPGAGVTLSVTVGDGS